MINHPFPRTNTAMEIHHVEYEIYFPSCWFFFFVILVLLCIDFSWSRFLRRGSSAFDRLRLMGLVALLMRQPWLCRLHSQLALMASINVAVVACGQLGKGLDKGFAWRVFVCDGFLEFWLRFDNLVIIWVTKTTPWLTTYKPLGTHHPWPGLTSAPLGGW